MSDEERWAFASDRWDKFREGLKGKKWDFTGIDDYSDLEGYNTFTDAVKDAFVNKDKVALKKELYRTGNLGAYNILFWNESGKDGKGGSNNGATSANSTTGTTGTTDKKMIIGDKSYDINVVNKFYNDLKSTNLQNITPINVEGFLDYTHPNAYDRLVEVVNKRTIGEDDEPLIYRPESKFTNTEFNNLLAKLPKDDEAINKYLSRGETESLFNYISEGYDDVIMNSDLSEETKAKYKLLSKGIDGLKNYTHMYKGIIPITYNYDGDKGVITRNYKYDPSNKEGITKMFLDYVNYNTNPNKLEKGGVIKAKDGDSLQKLHDSIKRDRTNKTNKTNTTPTKSNNDLADNFKPQPKPEAKRPRTIMDKRVVSEEGKEKPFDDIDVGDAARIGAVTADIVGLVAGLVPGGSAVSAASGLVSTASNAAANYADGMNW